jgi:nicotinate-nucleotide adenylyltransferase
VSNPGRIGVFGGTFDPVHNTHVAIAEAALKHARLDLVFFVVAARPPHKNAGPHADAETRYDMVQAALAGHPHLRASRAELDREGPSYTRDTLREFQQASPEARLFLIIGFDSLKDLPGWKDPDAILSRARLLVVQRGGEENVAPAELAGHYDVLPVERSELSSTEIRERIRKGQPWAGFVPEGAARIIRDRGLYH